MWRPFQSTALLSFLIFCIQILALAVIRGGSGVVLTVHGNDMDKLALLAIKARITDDPLRITSSWNDSLHFCQWQGVSCGHKHRRVTRLNLTSLNLKGFMSVSIGNLSFLRSVDLSNNSFHGELPNEIGRLFRLQELVLENNIFGGRIPTSLSNCSKLRTLDLGVNEFAGDIPFELGFLPKLENLILERNKLEGNIPSHLGNISSLQRFYMSINKLHGDIPTSLGQLKNLIVLSLALNMLSGTIPQSLYNFSRLEVFYVSENQLQGSFPRNIGLTLPNIKIFGAWENQLSGTIPVSFSNASNLVNFEIHGNHFSGRIPAIFGNLKKLESVSLALNMLSGTIPQSLYNFSRLEVFIVGGNQLQGSFPRNIGLTLPNIKYFLAWENQLSGTIPVSFSNASNLVDFQIHGNNFSGRIPAIFGNLKKLERVSIGASNLGYGKVNDMDFFTSFTNCSNLQELQIFQNNFGGALPNSVGNLSAKLDKLALFENGISGNLPPSIGNLISLRFFSVLGNRLTGTIPASIGRIHNLVELYMDSNELSGEIPSSFGNFTSLTRLYLEENHLQGNIPSSLENCQHLLVLYLYDNFLNGTIPPDVIGLSSLAFVQLFGNRLTGTLPLDVGKSKNLVEFGVSHNQLTGKIPSSLGECISLRWLYMEHNMFKGTIESLRSLRAIEEINLSHNNFSGHIPNDFGKFIFLSKLDLSFNDLEGEVPYGGIFSNASANISLDGNGKLCGGMAVLHLAPCSKKSPRKKNLSFTGKMIISLVGGLLGVCLISLFLIFCCFKKKMKQQSPESLWRDVPFLNISYGELLKATNGFCSENLIGVGGFSSVYKGIHESLQLPMAVKVFNLERRGASKSFMAECETLRNIRHRNLVKIITACSSVDFQGNDFKALVYEFLSNGSLVDWLHRYPQTGESQRKSLTLAERLNVVIDVASALDYLHNHSELPIIHCDLKPSNILLDQDMTSHVGDFGLSRIIAEDDVPTSQNHTSSLGIIGTIGYIAPEYGMGSKVSIEGDVFSFGILLLEIFTGKKPTDENLDGLGLHQFVKMALPTKVMEIVDQCLLVEGEEEASRSGLTVRTRKDRVYECLISVFTIGLMCSEELPRERMKINDALNDLLKIKKMLLKYARNTYRA